MVEEELYICNSHLTYLEKEIYRAIQTDNHLLLADYLSDGSIDINFNIEVEQSFYYKPLMLATIKGYSNCLKVILA